MENADANESKEATVEKEGAALVKASKNTATTREKKGTRSKKESLPTDEEEDIPERIYRVMTNRNHVRKFFTEESMTYKLCDKYIQLAFEEKKAKAQSHSLSDSNDDKEKSMPKQPSKKEQLQAIPNSPTRRSS
jgi:predicted NodU family carbamoyl transferase